MRSERLLTLVVAVLVMTSVSGGGGQALKNPWSLTLHGGAWLSPNGDIRTYWRAYDGYFGRWVEAYGSSKSGSLDWPLFGTAWGGEIARSIGSRLDIGLAVERLAKKHAGSFALGTGQSDRLEMSLSGVATTAFAAYSFPLADTLAFMVRGGVGILFASLDTIQDSRNGSGLGVKVTGSFSGAGLVAQASGGLDWEIGPKFAVRLEGGYCLASLPRWSGEDVHDWGSGSARHNGTLYYVEMQPEPGRLPNGYYPALILGDPSLGTNVVGYRVFKSDFTGFLFRMGLLFRFG